MATSGSSQSTASSSPVAVSVLDDPRLAQLFGSAQGAIPSSLSSIYDLVGQGSNSPLMQEIISRGLTSLHPGEAMSRQAVTDAARGAGGLRGTAYMQGMARNEGGILGNQSNLIGDLLSKTLGTLVSGELQQQQNQFLAPKAMTDLLQASRPGIGQQTSSQSTTNYGGDTLGGDASGYLNDWLNTYRRSGSPFGAGAGGTDTGGGWLGVNPKPNPMPTVAQNPYGGYGFNPGGGAPSYVSGGSPQGNYNWTANQGGNTNPQNSPQSYNPQQSYGPWVPATPGVPGTGSWAGYPPQQDQWGYNPQQWQQDPYYNNPGSYASTGWEY